MPSGQTFSTSVFGSFITPSGSGSCPVTGIFVGSGNDNPGLTVQNNLPSPANGGTAYYLTWDISSNPTINIDYDYDSSSVELGVEMTSSGTGIFYFQNQNYPNSTLYLSNGANNFYEGTIFQIAENVNLQIGTSAGASTITGVQAIELTNGGLSAPYGMTLTADIEVTSDANGFISGGTSSDAPLIIDGLISGLSGGTVVGAGDLYLTSGYITLSGAYPPTGDGVILLGSGTTQIVGQDSFGSNAFGWQGNINNSTLLFPSLGGSIAITSTLVFNSGDTVYGGTIDVNGTNVTWSGDFINTSSNFPQVQVINSNLTDGGFYLDLTSSSSLASNVEFLLTSGNFLTNFSADYFPNIIILQGGCLYAQDNMSYGELYINGGSTSSLYFPSSMSASIASNGSFAGPGILDVIGAGGSFTIVGGTGFSGTLNLIPNDSLTVYEDGANVVIATENDVTIGAPMGIGGSGLLFITMQNTGTLTAQADIKGVITLEGQLSLSDDSITITFLEDATTSHFSTVTGSLASYTDVIKGAGSVVIAGSTIFGSSLNPISNSFSGGLVLTSGSLEVYSSTSLGTGTLTGNGGELISEQSSNMVITNNWVFNTGTTTSFTSYDGITVTGNISTGGASGIAAIEIVDGSLAINTPLLTLNDGTSFQTNGTSLTVSNLSGTGGLILGGGTTHAPITDTLTISGTVSCTYAGTISDNSSAGNGAVEILAPVTFTGTNTFSGGLTLSSNSDTANTSVLTINGGTALGSGDIYANGGGLATAAASVTQAITVTNDWVFTINTNTTLDVISAETTLELNGKFTSSSLTGTAYITKEGAGVLYIGQDSSFTEGSEYELTIAKGNATVNSTPLTTSSYFLEDGILYGDRKDFFALAEAKYENWWIKPVSLSPAILNVIIQGPEGSYPSLRGNGTVTNVEVYERGLVIPGVSFKVGALEVIDSVVFHPNTHLGIAINADEGSILMVENNVHLDSSVFVIIAPESGPYLHTNHVILTAGYLDGRFEGFSIPNAYFIDGFLDYSVPNEVILSIYPRNIADLATGANALAVANTLDTVILWNRGHVDYYFTSTPNPSSPHPFLASSTPPLLENVLESLLPLNTEEEMTDALNQLQPAFLKGFTIVQEDNIVKMQDTLSNRMEYILNTNGCFTFSEDKRCCEKDDKIFHAWVSGMGDILAQDSNTYAGSPQVGYQSKMGGFAAGIDGHFAKVLYLGGIGGYTTSCVNWKQNQGTGNINTGYAGVYLSAVSDMFYGNVSVIGGFSNFSSKRNIQYTGVDLTASGRHAGKQLLSHVDTGFNWNIGGFTIRPFDSFDYVTQTETAYDETGAGEWNLSVNKTNAIYLRNELGLTLSTCLCFSNMKWVVAPKASWIREVRVKGDTFTASFTEATPADAPFTVTGYFPDRSLFSPGVTLTGSMCQDRLTVQLNYNGAFTGGYSDHSYGGEVRYAF